MLLRRPGVVSKAAALGFLATASSGRAEDLAPSLLVGALGPAIVAQTEPTLSEPGELARPPPPRNHWLPALEIVGWSLVQNRWSFAGR